MFRPRLTAALALCMVALAQAQLAPPGFDCASLPNNWGQDQDQNNNNNNNNNNNDPWQALATAPTQATLQQVYNTFLSRYSNAPLSGWEPSCNWTATAFGCQQNYGWGQWTGMNQALQINYTCGSNTLGMLADVNLSDGYINVDDLDVFALWADGALQAGSNIDENSLSWWEGNDDVWGQFYNLMTENNQDNNQDNNNNNNNSNENENNDQNNNNDQNRN